MTLQSRPYFATSRFGCRNSVKRPILPHGLRAGSLPRLFASPIYRRFPWPEDTADAAVEQAIVLGYVEPAGGGKASGGEYRQVGLPGRQEHATLRTEPRPDSGRISCSSEDSVSPCPTCEDSERHLHRRGVSKEWLPVLQRPSVCGQVRGGRVSSRQRPAVAHRATSQGRRSYLCPSPRPPSIAV